MNKAQLNSFIISFFCSKTTNFTRCNPLTLQGLSNKEISFPWTEVNHLFLCISSLRTQYRIVIQTCTTTIRQFVLRHRRRKTSCCTSRYTIPRICTIYLYGICLVFKRNKPKSTFIFFHFRTYINRIICI